MKLNDESIILLSLSDFKKFKAALEKAPTVQELIKKLEERKGRFFFKGEKQTLD